MALNDIATDIALNSIMFFVVYRSADVHRLAYLT